MKALFAMDRRIQDMERRLDNMKRIGKVTETKYDAEKKRWYVKMQEGSDEKAFKTDWLPWKSFAHGAISMTIPPKKGQHIAMVSPGGWPEMAVAEPFHYGPETPSPHDKEDEIFIKVKKPAAEGQGATEADTPDETLTVHATKDGSTIIIGSTTINVTKDTVTITTKNAVINASEKIELKTKAYSVECESHTIQADTFVAKTGSVDWSQ